MVEGIYRKELPQVQFPILIPESAAHLLLIHPTQPTVVKTGFIIITLKETLVKNSNKKSSITFQECWIITTCQTILNLKIAPL